VRGAPGSVTLHSPWRPHAHLELLQLGDCLVLLLGRAKEPAHGAAGGRQLLAQPDQLAERGLDKVGHGQQAQRVPGRRRVEHDAAEARVLLPAHKLDHLRAAAAPVRAVRREA